MPENKEFHYKPEILCVARNQSLKYEVYSTQDSELENAPWSKVEEQFLKNTDIVNKIYEANMVDLDQDGAYITSVGACKGDSGGPMFTKSKKNKHFEGSCEVLSKLCDVMSISVTSIL